MNIFERGKRTEFADDDIWIHGDDACEVIIPQEEIIIDKKFLNDLDSVLSSSELLDLMKNIKKRMQERWM